MAGIAIYNPVFPAKNFEFAIMPLYSFRNNKVRGYGSLGYRFNFRESSFIHSIKTGFNFASFGIIPYSSFESSNPNSEFIKIAPSLEIKLKKKEARSVHQHSLLYRYIFIEEKQAAYCESCDSISVMSINDMQFHELNYLYKNSNTLHPWNLKFTTRYSSEMLLNMIELNYKRVYNRYKNGIYLRLFAGGFLSNTGSLGRYNLRMDGQRGYHDYLYDEVFPARFDNIGLWSQQFIESYGGFKVPTAFGQSNKFLVALNLKADLPIAIFKPFVDFGAGYTGNEMQFLYDAGIAVQLGKGFCSIYFPLLYSQEIKDELSVNNKTFKHTIRFTFNLSQVNPLKLIRDL
jgi:hypothetical protein